MSQLVRSLAVLGALGLTAACGDNPTDRALILLSQKTTG
jgi:hypothetical protein